MKRPFGNAMIYDKIHHGSLSNNNHHNDKEEKCISPNFGNKFFPFQRKKEKN